LTTQLLVTFIKRTLNRSKQIKSNDTNMSISKANEMKLNQSWKEFHYRRGRAEAKVRVHCVPVFDVQWNTSNRYRKWPSMSRRIWQFYIPKYIHQTIRTLTYTYTHRHRQIYTLWTTASLFNLPHCELRATEGGKLCVGGIGNLLKPLANCQDIGTVNIYRKGWQKSKSVRERERERARVRKQP